MFGPKYFDKIDPVFSNMCATYIKNHKINLVELLTKRLKSSGNDCILISLEDFKPNLKFICSPMQLADIINCCNTDIIQLPKR